MISIVLVLLFCFHTIVLLKSCLNFISNLYDLIDVSISYMKYVGSQ